MPVRRLLPALLLLVAAACTPFRAGPETPPERWWKGNLHAHSLWSDGDDFPENVLDWYRRNGYDFASLTDQDVVPATGRWINLADHPGAAAGIDDYRARFPDAVDERTRGDSVLVRLATVGEYRFSLEEPNAFLVIPGQEITQLSDGRPVHTGAWNVTGTVPRVTDGSSRAMIRANVRAVQEQTAQSGRVAAAQLNHPNLGWAVTAEDLVATPALRLFELYNGRPAAANRGDSLHVGTERMWDIALAVRLARRLPPIWGTAADDASDYHTIAQTARNPGRGWIMVRAPALSPDAIMQAVLDGDFYASTGVVLDDVSRSPDHVSLGIRPMPGVSYRTQFIGTRTSANLTGSERHDSTGRALTRSYGAGVGEVLATVSGTTPSYTPDGDELYVRARVTSSRLKADAASAGEFEMAWTQPVVVARPAHADSVLTVVTLNIWHDQQSWPARLAAIVDELRGMEPDVIALQEVLQHDSLPNQAMDIAARIGYDWYFTSVDSTHHERRYGNAILTKHPVLVRDWVALEPAGDHRSAAHVRLAFDGRQVDVYATHLHPGETGDSIRAQQVDHLLRFINRTRGDGPIVLAGDFNALTTSPELAPLHERFIDAYGTLHGDSVAVTTLVTELGHTARRIDHVFVEDGRLRPIAADIIFGAPIGTDLWLSDHYGVSARVLLLPDPVPADRRTPP